MAVAVAATGAVSLPDGVTGGSYASVQSLSMLPERPQVYETGGAIDGVVTAQELLGQESTESARAAHNAVVIEERQKAAERAARAKREAKRWVLPLTKFRLSAYFGASGRMWSSRHTGLDFAAPYGTPVRSVSSGVIVDAGWAPSYGYRVIVRHWDGTETWYAHLSRIVRRSGAVATGEVIGRVGSTGNSTGNHLHFEVHPDGGDAINPLTWLRRRGLNI